MIRYGPAGIPVSSKGRTLKDAIENVYTQNQTAMEIQMVRPNVQMATPEDEVGKSVRDLDADSGFVIGIQREGESIYDPDVLIEDDDNLIIMQSAVAPRFGDLRPLGRMAVRHDVSLSVHTPYYIDLCDPIEDELAALDGVDEARAALNERMYSIGDRVMSGEITEEEADAEMRKAEAEIQVPHTPTLDAIENAVRCGFVLNELGGTVVATNLGIYAPGKDRGECEDHMMEALGVIVDRWKEMKLKPLIGIENTAHNEVWGSMDQVLDLCSDRKFKKYLVPVLNFAHYQSRSRGALATSEDFKDLIDQYAPFYEGRGNVYSQFSNVEFWPASGNEKWLTPLKKGEIKYDRLAECLAEYMPQITLISGQPLMEHDATYMKILAERALTKKVSKMLKEKRKQAEKEAAAKGNLAPADPNDEGE